jgi:transketolase
MRAAFITTLMQLAENDERIVFLTGDLGFSVLESFSTKFPNRFYNFGVSEQNMTGAAAGLALCGKKAISYSITPFVTMRPFEQVRIDIAFQKANVIIVGVGSGFSYGSLGPTHHATEDIALMRALPNMVVLCPGDPVEAALATRAAVAHDGPVYLRLGKGKEPIVHKTPPEALVIGGSFLMRDGSDVTIISTGDGLANAAAAAEQLAKEGISARHISMPCVKPLDRRAVLKAADETRILITVEEHQVNGGLGSAVAETLAEAGVGVPLLRIGVPDRFMDHAGSQQYLRRSNGLDAQSIIDRIRKALEERP